jgi:hypothetical protein
MPDNAAPCADKLLRQEEAAQMLNLSPRALEAWRHRGGGPRFLRISGRCIRYRLGDLHAWLVDRERSSTSAA